MLNHLTGNQMHIHHNQQILFFKIDCWLSGIADSHKMDLDDFIEVLEENYHLFEMFANAEFTEALMVCILILIFLNFQLCLK